MEVGLSVCDRISGDPHKTSVERDSRGSYLCCRALELTEHSQAWLLYVSSLLALLVTSAGSHSETLPTSGKLCLCLSPLAPSGYFNELIKKCVSLCVSLFVYIYMCEYVCTFVYVCICRQYGYAYMGMCVCKRVYVCMCVCEYVVWRHVCECIVCVCDCVRVCSMCV